nr:porin [uncultured Roseateles sp.]
MLSTTYRFRPTALALGILMIGAQAQAQDKAPGESIFSLSGFGTLGVVKTDTDEARYRLTGQPRGATTEVSADVDTKIGVQVGAKFSPMFSATVQVLSKQNGYGSYQPAVEWAFAKAQFSPSLSVRVGRMGAPLFAVSDFRDVGYANTWLRPPQDVYGQVPLSHFDGADANYQVALGSSTLTFQLYGGKSDSVVTGNKVKLDSMVGLNATAELDGGFSIRLGHVQGKLTVENAGLGALVGILSKTPFASVGQEMDATKKHATFTGLGLGYDQGNVLALLEYTRRKTDSYVPSTTGWFATVGYRLGKFTPYVTLSELHQDSSNVNTSVIPVGVPISPAIPDLRRYIDGVVLQSQSTRQKTKAAGVRWDFYRNTDLKFQYERITPNGPGLFGNAPLEFNKPVNVYSLAVDMVF